MQLRVSIAAAAAVALAAFAPDAAAKPKKRPRNWIASVLTPVGLQGTAGGGGDIVIPFSVAASVGRRAEVEAQFAIDLNLDGSITDDEYRPATENRFDARDTRSDAAPQLYAASSQPVYGAYVWKSLADVGAQRFPMLEFAITQQGRFIPDVLNPGSYLIARGPSGGLLFGGVKVRLRTVWRKSKRAKLQSSPWVESDAFVLDNSITPTATIDAVSDGSAMTVHWTAFDGDSEDLNGNGQLDIASGEDANNNNVLDCERMGIAFDWRRLAPGEDPIVMTDEQLAALPWSPCTRVPQVGDTDSLDARPGVPVPQAGPGSGVCSAPPGIGRHYTFAWNAAHDAGASKDGLLLRATPFCEHRKHGPTVYWRTIVRTQP